MSKPAYYAHERVLREMQVEDWARLLLAWRPERRADFERQAAAPRAPNVSVKAHVFACKVLAAVRRIEGA